MISSSSNSFVRTNDVSKIQATADGSFSLFPFRNNTVLIEKYFNRVNGDKHLIVNSFMGKIQNTP